MSLNTAPGAKCGHDKHPLGLIDGLPDLAAHPHRHLREAVEATDQCVGQRKREHAVDLPNVSDGILACDRLGSAGAAERDQAIRTVTPADLARIGALC